MISDHFAKWHRPSTDWNFNITFENQPQVGELARSYQETLAHPRLYPPIPAEWLHMTILRASVSHYSDEEMSAITKKLRPTLADAKLPEFSLADCWIWEGDVVMQALPRQPLDKLYEATKDAFTQVVGPHKVPKIEYPFIPHISLAYGRSQTTAEGLHLHRQLLAHTVEFVSFRVTDLSLLKQEQVQDFYKWDVIQKLPIGQDETLPAQ